MYKERNLNDSTCLVTIFLLETLCQESKETSNTNFFNTIFTKYVLPFHEIIISKYLKKSIYSTSDTATIIAFFKMHCQLSNHSSSLELVKKYSKYLRYAVLFILFSFFLFKNYLKNFYQQIYGSFYSNSSWKMINSTCLFKIHALNIFAT